jgi:SAM-dependent methyltransferase
MAEPVTVVDADVLRGEVRQKYRAVAVEPDGNYHFHTGRPLVTRLGYDQVIAKATATAEVLGVEQVEFRSGYAEALPVEDGWADVVISNGVINLCADKRAVFQEIHRVLRPGGVLQFADIANGRPVPIEVMRDVDLWTG